MIGPASVELPSDFAISNVFDRFAARTGCLWFDSASDRPARQARYSFLTSDPLRQITASVKDPDPWPGLLLSCDSLPRNLDPNLPPFQGGIAGLIGYEAATWLEAVAPPAVDDLPTPALSMGIYDWTIATDHQLGQSWIIARDVLPVDDPDQSVGPAQRCEEVLQFVLGKTDHIRPGDSTTANFSDSAAEILPAGQHLTQHVGVTSNFRGESFCDQVAEIVKRIRRGDSFQVNLAQRLLTKTSELPSVVYRSLRAQNPAPFAAYYNGGGFQVLSSSPEGFLKVDNGKVETRPIKGTTPRVGDEVTDAKLGDELSASEKNRAENIMIVDLMRNDLSRVCTDDSVELTQLCELEEYQFVQHLVSVVEGKLRPEQNVGTLLKACFPGGSVTGAPKIEAMKTISELEPNPRGPYCGSMGYISTPTTADFNILIRTITMAHGYCQVPVGGGITARSQPKSELTETWTKAEGMLRALRPHHESNDA